MPDRYEYPDGSFVQMTDCMVAANRRHAELGGMLSKLDSRISAEDRELRDEVESMTATAEYYYDEYQKMLDKNTWLRGEIDNLVLGNAALRQNPVVCAPSCCCPCQPKQFDWTAYWHTRYPYTITY